MLCVIQEVDRTVKSRSRYLEHRCERPQETDIFFIISTYSVVLDLQSQKSKLETLVRTSEVIPLSDLLCVVIIRCNTDQLSLPQSESACSESDLSKPGSPFFLLSTFVRLARMARMSMMTS